MATSNHNSTPTRAFRFERDMLQSVRETLPSKLGFDSLNLGFILCEPTVGNMIPDVVLARATENLILPKKPFSLVEAHILALIEEHRELSELEVLAYLYLTESGARRAFAGLRKSGLIQKTDTGKMAVDSSAFTRAVEIIAIELKLRRWREALTQARTYLKFADRAYVVLDGNQVQPDSAMEEEFRSVSVGLFLHRGFWLEKIIEAPRTKPITPERIQAIQKLFQSSVSDS